MIKVSVIIPVYNAEKFLEKAVMSVLLQPEVGEIVIVEDGSHDLSYEVALRLCSIYPLIRLYTHPHRKNKGASASRALGVSKVTNEYIAFLDADDYYLPNRFSAENKLFENNDAIDGVYGATGFDYISEVNRDLYSNFVVNGLTTVSNLVNATELFYVLNGLSKFATGYFTLDALTVKRIVFNNNKAGNFNPNMGLHEDTEWIIRLSGTCTLSPGEITKAIVMRGVHEDNRIIRNKNENYTRFLMYASLYEWALHASIPKTYFEIIENHKISFKIFLVPYWSAFKMIIKQSFYNRQFLTQKVFVRRILIRLFGNRFTSLLVIASKFAR